MIETSTELNELFAALAKAQGAFPAIAKDKSARIQTKAGGAYSYDYADLATVLSAVRPALSANGLAILQQIALLVDTNRVVVTTVLAHASGQCVMATLQLPVNDARDPRSIASAITYARRYSLIGMLGVAPADEDDDGEAAQRRRPAHEAVVEVTNTWIETEPDGPRPPAPDGHRYIDEYRLENGWHHVIFLRADAQGGALTYSTKFELLGALAAKAFQEGIPVRVEGKPRDRGDGWWLNKLVLWRAEDSEAEPPTLASDPLLTDDDMPL